MRYVCVVCYMVCVCVCCVSICACMCLSYEMHVWMYVYVLMCMRGHQKTALNGLQRHWCRRNPRYKESGPDAQLISPPSSLTLPPLSL